LTARKRSGMSVLLLFSALLVPGLSDSTLGPQERGTVKVDSLPVYAEMSTDSDIVATLVRGKLVRITLSITNGDGSWCSVSNIDSSARLGFVRCEELVNDAMKKHATVVSINREVIPVLRYCRPS